MLQKNKPSDYVIATGISKTVKQFVEEAFKCINVKIAWKGKGIKAKCYDLKGNCFIECDKEYYRPLEVDTLLGDAKKAKKELNWKPKVDIKMLVKEMVSFELKRLT